MCSGVAVVEVDRRGVGWCMCEDGGGGPGARGPDLGAVEVGVGDEHGVPVRRGLELPNPHRPEGLGGGDPRPAGADPTGVRCRADALYLVVVGEAVDGGEREGRDDWVVGGRGARRGRARARAAASAHYIVGRREGSIVAKSVSFSFFFFFFFLG